MFYEIQDFDGNVKTTTDFSIALNAIRKGFVVVVVVVEIQESTFYTTDTMVKTIVAHELKGS
jgi:hypothetical protein